MVLAHAMDFRKGAGTCVGGQQKLIYPKKHICRRSFSIHIKRRQIVDTGVRLDIHTAGMAPKHHARNAGHASD